MVVCFCQNVTPNFISTRCVLKVLVRPRRVKPDRKTFDRRMSKMFFDNLRLEKCIQIINSIEDGKFPLLLSRVAQFLSNGTTPKPFTSVEEEKLVNSLEITRSEVETLIDGIIELFRTCAYHVIKPTILGEQLEKSLSMNAKKSEIFVQVWTSSARGIIDNLKQMPYFPQLSHISYSISIEAASQSASKEKIPKAQLQLGLVAGNDKDELNLEFNHKQLYEFYQNLEQIQGQLDAFR